MDIVEKFGSARISDGGLSESHNKYFSKTTSERSQGRIDVFGEQRGFNLAAKMVLDRAYRNNAMKCSKGSYFKSIPKVTSNFGHQED